MTDQCNADIKKAEEALHELEEQMQSNEEFQKHMAKLRAVMREAQKCVESGFITKAFVDQYIDKIFATPEEDGTIRLDIRIFTGEATEKYLEKLKVRSGQINHPIDHPEETSTAATTLGVGVHPGHTSNIVIEDGVTAIGTYAFRDCANLTSVTIPASVTAIGSNAFSNCTALAEVNISDLAAWCTIESGAYSANPVEYAGALTLNGEVITDLVIPEGVTAVPVRAFYNCDSLISVKIPDSVTGIGDSAFYNCDNLQRAFIPESVSQIGSCVFYGWNYDMTVYCAAASEAEGWSDEWDQRYSQYSGGTQSYIYIYHTVYWNATEEEYDYWNALDTGAKNIVVPEYITRIHDTAFVDCGSLESVYIHSGVTYIEADAYNDKGPFVGCPSGAEIYCAASSQPEGWKSDAKPGTVTIKVTANDGSKKSATVKVQFGTYAKTMTIDNKDTFDYMTSGDKAVTLTATVDPGTVGYVWSLKNTADKSYVTLTAAGKLTPKNVTNPQKVTIVATTKDGRASDEHTITIDPADATNKKLTWEITSGGEYATISASGVLKAKKVTVPTEVEVTVTAQDGSEVSDTCIVTITP